MTRYSLIPAGSALHVEMLSTAHVSDFYNKILVEENILSIEAVE